MAISGCYGAYFINKTKFYEKHKCRIITGVQTK